MRKLNKSEISCKVKQIGERGCLILLYKTARVDAQILDETFGAGNWTNDFKEIKGNLYCGIGVNINGNYVWKWDCGVESATEAEKGEASDAFKRAGFKWGIGVELYSAPFIWAQVKTVKNSQGRWELDDKFMKFSVAEISYDEDKIIGLTVVDNKNNIVFKRSFFQNKPEEHASPKMITDEQFEELQNLGADMMNLAKAFKVPSVTHLTYEQAEQAITKKRGQSHA